MDLVTALKISASGMKAQGTRLRVLSENIANADSAAAGPGLSPYRRKLVTFANTLDRALGAETVKVNRVSEAPGVFPMRYDPSHPAANNDGYVQLPNVNVLIEMMDFREAQRSYEANLNVLEASKRMIESTIQILRA